MPKILTKWDYLRKISALCTAAGDAYNWRGILQLLMETGKTSTPELTLEECREFYERMVGDSEQSSLDKHTAQMV